MIQTPRDPARDRAEAAADAWLRGQESRPDAMHWLARAARLAPNDPRIALDLARTRLGGTPADLLEAAAAFARIAARYDEIQAWLGLAMAHQRLRNPALAAAAIGNLLARHCIPEEPGFSDLAVSIAAAAGYGGFHGMEPSGKLRVLGSGKLFVQPLDIAAFTRIDGLVAADKDGLSGWACRLAAPSKPPKLILSDAAGNQLAVKFGNVLPADDDAPLLRRHSFKISNRQLRGLTPPFALRGPDGANIMGSPIDPLVLAIPPLAAAIHPAFTGKILARRKLAIIIPVYRGLTETQACLDALFAAIPAATKIIVVDDATPEPPLAAWLDNLAAKRRIQLCRHPTNRGFAASVNTGLAAAGKCDILLLNSDTLMPPGAIETLREIAYAAADTGSVTPFSNEATILSYPDRRGGNPAPDLAGTIALNALAAKANLYKSQEIPTGIGFCMYLRYDCLQATGGFRDDIFAQGYGEENDWCIRARHRGFTHRAALGAYVAHIGGVSFGAAARGLTTRNLAILNRLYPDYHAMIMAHIAADPLAPARARIDSQRLHAAPKRDAVLLISHSHGGGVARQIAAQIEQLRAQNLRPLLLTTQFPDNPENTPYPWPAVLTEGDPDAPSNLHFTLPNQSLALQRLLRALRVSRVTLHHTLGHHAYVRGIAAALAVPQDIIIHDYTSFCPRVNLLTRPAPMAALRYCGEPSPAGCIDCCTRNGTETSETLPIPALLARSNTEFTNAASIIAPSEDAAKRIARHFPNAKPIITPWENDALPTRFTPPRTGLRRIVVIGGIGHSKGFEVLADCARDAAARDLALEFIVAGSSADDAELMATGRIFVTGAYAEGEAQALIAGFKPDLAFLPSIWPETWCFALSEAWRAGLYAVSFDLGAQAARIKATGRGITLPLGLPASRINDILAKWTP